MSTPDKSKENTDILKDESVAASDDGSPKVEDIQDAVVVQDEPGDDAKSDESSENTAQSEGDEVAADDTTDVSVVADEDVTVLDDDKAAETGDSANEADASSESEAASSTDPVVPVPPVVERETVVRKGGFVPMVLGGVVAAALGFFAAPSLQGMMPFLAPPADPFEDEARAALEAQAGDIEGLQSQLQDVSGAVQGIDLSTLEGSVGDLGARFDAVEGAITDLSDQVAGFDSRLTALEKEPLTAAVSPEAIAAYERELEELRVAIETQRSEIENMAAEAVAAEQSATEQAGVAQARAALAQVNTALQNGDPLGDALQTLGASGVTVPDALSSVAADGVSTLSALADDFPSLARDALDAARKEQPVDGGGFGSFLQRQLGARSVTPRDGDDPDAVLSRAENAVRNGDLATALNELSALPEAAKAVMAEWTSRAQARQAALEAANSLAQELN